MKPIKLTINAFGPYVNKTEIDFTKFGENGIYLITGDTGAGKTTIFDALSYALFGAASGSARNAQSLRSDFADENNKSYVEFEFLSNGDKYFVRRECAYKRINRNGREVTESEKAELIKPNKETLSRPDEVTSEIENILGINKKQFAQIVMIAQGEFQKFLNAPTKDKEEIFRNIFNTYYYNAFQDKIKNEFANACSEKKTIETRLQENIKKINCSNNEELAELKAENNIYDLVKLLEMLEENVKSDNENLKIYEKQLEKFEKEIPKSAEEIREYELIENDRKTLGILKTELPNLEKKSLENEQKLQALKNQEKDREALAAQISKLELSIPEYAELAKKTADRDIKKETLSDLILKLKKDEDDLAEKEEQKINSEKRLKEIENVDVELVNTENKQEKILAQGDSLKTLMKTFGEYTQEKQHQENLEAELKEAANLYEELKKTADEKYNAFFCNQAGFLAKDLKDGDECPVCGAVHHPKKAKLTADVLSKEDVEKSKKDAEIAQKNSLDKSEKLNKLKSNTESLEKQLLKNETLKIENLIGFEEKLENAISENSQNKDSLEKQLVLLKNQQKEKKDLQKRLADFDKLKKAIDEKIEKTKKEINDYESQIAAIEATIEEKKSKLEYKSIEDVKKVLSSTQDKLKKMKDDLEAAEKAKNDSLAELQNKKGQIKQLDAKLKNTKIVDIAKLKSEKEEKEQKKQALSAEKTEIYSRHSNNSELLSDIRKLDKNFQDISSDVEMLDSINRTANGNLTGGKQKITFENYILSTFFEEIIEAANKRFREMTSSQFELRRNLQKGGNTKTGLDLDVYDYYTAKSREVSTLSGGESFKAALALSLGLSDIVQQKAGGVQIDTMFIDEGFGSLDPESLEQTMRTLMDLSGNKTLIGIISHVAELREKIDKKILVTKTQSGSNLKIELP